MPKLTACQYLRQRMRQKKLPGRSLCKSSASRLHALIADEQKRHGTKPVPECFGKAFAAPEEPMCRRCPVQVLCMHRCAHVRLLEAQAACGSHAVAEVAKATRWSPDMVRRLQKICRMTDTLRAQDINRVLQPKVNHEQPTRSWPARFLKERRRIPALNYLKPGTKLFRTYKGETHVVQVQDGSYIYQGQHFPTLYCVAMKVTGYKSYGRPGAMDKYRRTMSNFSVNKFFMRSIEQAMPSL